MLTAQVVEFRGIRRGLNYGLDRVRFMSPVPVGSRLRAGVELVGGAQIDGGVQYTLRTTFAVEGSPRPSCVAESIARRYL
jgi:acyl dehydratase